MTSTSSAFLGRCTWRETAPGGSIEVGRAAAGRFRGPDPPRRRSRETREVAVKPPPFSYAAPTTLAEAVGLLTEHAEAEPRVLAGGQSLIPLMNFRLAKPGYLIDLRNVAGLSGIRREGDTLVIGAMTTMSEVERSAEVAVAARSGGQPLETVGAIAEYDPGTGSFTIDTNTL